MKKSERRTLIRAIYPAACSMAVAALSRFQQLMKPKKQLGKCIVCGNLIRTINPNSCRCTTHSAHLLSMRKQITAGVFFFMATTSLWAQPLQFSRVDGTIWECDATAPQLAYPIGIGERIVGPKVFGGSLWGIDATANTLIKDGQEVGPLSWYDGRVWDAQPVNGFTVGLDGTGWLAGPDSEDGAVSFLVRVDLGTGAVTPIGPLGFDPSPVDGIAVIPEPSGLEMVVTMLMTLVMCDTKNRRQDCGKLTTR